jgi:hypothetical protein
MSEKKNPEHTFYISDYTEYFESIARMFFDEPINLVKENIWKD